MLTQARQVSDRRPFARRRARHNMEQLRPIFNIRRVQVPGACLNVSGVFPRLQRRTGFFGIYR